MTEVLEKQIWRPRDSATAVEVVSVHLLEGRVRVRRLDRGGRRGDVGVDAERVSQRGAHPRGREGGGGEDDMTEQADQTSAPVQAGDGMIFAGGGVE